MASIRRTTRCQLMAHLLIKTWYRRIGRPKLNTSEANYYQEQLRNGIPAEAGPNETSRLLGSQRGFYLPLITAKTKYIPLIAPGVKYKN